jgi:hypothetical protein
MDVQRSLNNMGQRSSRHLMRSSSVVLQIDTFARNRNAGSGIVPQGGSLQRPRPAALSGSLTKAPGSAGGYLLVNEVKPPLDGHKLETAA